MPLACYGLLVSGNLSDQVPHQARICQHVLMRGPKCCEVHGALINEIDNHASGGNDTSAVTCRLWRFNN